MKKIEKIKSKIGIIIGFILLLSLVYWLFWGRIITIETNGKNLNKIVNLECFELLQPDMSRTEISEKMGQPTKIDVPYVEKENDYVEIRWIYERPKGLLNYYVEQEDIPGGSVEYIPNNMDLNNFLMDVPKSLFGKKFIEINDKKNHLITIKLKRNKKIRTINWYNQKTSNTEHDSADKAALSDL